MKAERLELAALASVAGPRATPEEINTYAYLADFAAVCEQVARVPEEVRQERVQALRAIVARPVDVEAMRAAFWLRAPLAARMVAVMSAKLPKERAGDTLNKFDALERGLIWVALERLMADLAQVQKCMQGGAMPTTSSRAH
ncbi:hypothetical protein [Massilia sp. DD77]|uniref:hypothetical protein n=1 Tax=Massilia sp. DD77 TaxID=3109349 RepID=UPI002FFE8BA5